MRIVTRNGTGQLFSMICLWSACVCFATPVPTAAFDHSHRLLDRVLKRFVSDGLVNYAALKADPKELNQYLDQLANVRRDDFKEWSESQQIAYLINVYNAQTLKLVIDHYPLKSLKDIGTLWRDAWDQPVVRFLGDTITLAHLEHKILRKNYDEPEIHFALVCAARGCPPLRDEPYIGEKLEIQFADQGRLFLSNPEKNYVDVNKRVIYLSPIFKWFKEDFAQKSGSIPKFIQYYLPERLAIEVKKGGFKIKYTDYDWSLNDRMSK